MTQAVPEFRTGSEYKYRQAQWAPLYAALENILPAAATIIRLGDPGGGKINAASFTGRRANASGLAPAWTLSEALSAFDTPPSYEGPSGIPVITFNGIDEEADSPDAAWWTQDDAAGANGFSIGAWVNLTDATSSTLLAKWDDGGKREWICYFDSSDKLNLTLRDESASVQTVRASDATISEGIWVHCVVTYDGAGGATAGNTITVYVDGVAVASTASNDASYVGIEDLTGVVTLGHFITSSAADGLFDGKMAGGPLGPWMCLTELTAAEILNIYRLGAAALGLI